VFNERPPMLGGDAKTDLAALRDYLFRLASNLEIVAGAPAATGASTSVAYAGGAQPGGSSGNYATKDDIKAVRQNARELQSLIIKTATGLHGEIDSGDNAVMQYADSKVEEYNSLYVARSEYGEFQESINTTIENTAKGVVESYNYGSAIESVQADIGLMQNYYTSINGEIRRGIIQDPDTGDYVTGVAISQNLQFSGECGPSDPLNPGDGFTYYYLGEGQTFGLYTSTGWQFWIDGVKRGWFNSEDGMLHVKNVWVDSILHIGANWTIQQSGNALMISYVG